MQTAGETPGNYSRRYRDVPMVFEGVEDSETEDYYLVTLSFRPQGQFSGSPGQEQFFIEKEGTLAVRQVLSIPRRRGGFPLLPVAVGLGIVGVMAAVGAVFALGGPSDDGAPVAVVIPTETPAPTEASTPASEPVAIPSTDIPTNTSTATPMPTYTPFPTATPRPTHPPRPTPTARVIVVNPTLTPTPRPTLTPKPTPRPTLTPKPTPRPTLTPKPTPRPTLTPTLTPRPTLTPTPTPWPTRNRNALSYWYLGLRHYELGQYQQALEEFDKAIQLVPDSALYHMHRGNDLTATWANTNGP